MITTERLAEIETAPREACIFRAEAKELVDAYRERDEWQRIAADNASTSLAVARERNEWREAIHDELFTTWILSDENEDDPRLALQDIIRWHVMAALDPAVSSDARALIDQGKAMRDDCAKHL
jgi:hypothetical protein